MLPFSINFNHFALTLEVPVERSSQVCSWGVLFFHFSKTEMFLVR